MDVLYFYIYIYIYYDLMIFDGGLQLWTIGFRWGVLFSTLGIWWNSIDQGEWDKVFVSICAMVFILHLNVIGQTWKNSNYWGNWCVRTNKTGSDIIWHKNRE